MGIRSETIGGVLVVLPGGRIDSSNAGVFEQAVLGPVEAGQMRLVLDFAELDYISSAGLRVVMMAAKRLNSANGRMALCGLNESIREVFEISGFLRILTVLNTREEALAGV